MMTVTVTMSPAQLAAVKKLGQNLGRTVNTKTNRQTDKQTNRQTGSDVELLRK